MNPKVSVIIPCYNSERFIGATLDSVFAQTLSDLEVIVVDDGSTDRTREIVSTYEAVRYHYQPNRGPAAARNAGLRLARGKYLAFLDSDDLWHADMLASCVEILDKMPQVGAVHTNWLPIDADGRVIRRESGWQPWRGDIFERLLVYIPFNTSSVVWRREWWDRVGGFDETPEMNDDWVNWLRIAHLGCWFECIERPLVFRRHHSDALTHQQAERVISWRFNALDRVCSEFDIPSSLRDRAYAEVHWLATTVALREGRLDDASAHFRQMALRDPSRLGEPETYFAIAYAGDHYVGSAALDLDKALATVERLLHDLFSSADLPAALVEQEANIRGQALFTLARAGYGASPAYAGKARHLLLRSLHKRPSRLWSPDLRWVVRILLGKRFTEWGKQFVAGRITGQVISSGKVRR